jgi:hypothetical protein
MQPELLQNDFRVFVPPGVQTFLALASMLSGVPVQKIVPPKNVEYDVDDKEFGIELSGRGADTHSLVKENPAFPGTPAQPLAVQAARYEYTRMGVPVQPPPL